MTPGTDTLKAALFYASRGIRVFPVRDKAKCPRDWPAVATADEEAVAALWHGGANVACLCGPDSGLVDVNCNGEGAEETCRKVFGGEIPTTWTYRSRRGLHWWFRWREGLPPRARYLVGTLEIITGNAAAYTVAPPSVADGVRREWLAGLSPGDCELAEIPDAALAWLVNFAGASPEDLAGAPTTKRSPEEWLGILRGVPEGARNESMAAITGKWLRGLDNLDDGDLVRTVWEQVRLVNHRNDPPLDEDELRRTFESIYRREQRRRVAAEAEGETAAGVEAHTRDERPAGGDEWRLVIVDSDPPRYELHAPQFAQAEGGCLVLTARQMVSGAAIREQALEQAGYPLTKGFTKRWDVRQKQKDGTWKASLYERLILAAEHREAPPEEQRWRVVAELLLGKLERARELEEGQPPDPKGRPCRLRDGSVVFGFTAVWRDLNWEADKVGRLELSKLLTKLGVRQYREHGKRLSRLRPEGLSQLGQFANTASIYTEKKSEKI